MSFDDISSRFQVPARKGARVMVEGKRGTVTTARGSMVRVRLDGMRWSRPYDPGDLQWLGPDTESPGALPAGHR